MPTSSGTTPRTKNGCRLSEVGRNGWFALSRDKHIYYRPNEKEAVIRAKVELFIVVGKAPHRELARISSGR